MIAFHTRSMLSIRSTQDNRRTPQSAFARGSLTFNEQTTQPQVIDKTPVYGNTFATLMRRHINLFRSLCLKGHVAFMARNRPGGLCCSDS